MDGLVIAPSPLMTRLLGRSGLTVSQLGLGCTTFGREIDEAESFRLMDHAVAHGITLFDTAEAYGCEEPYEANAECELTKSRCRDGRFFLEGFDCAAEATELSDCKARGSSLD